MPLPLGANRDWAWPFAVAALGLLAAIVGTGIATARWRVSHALVGARLPLLVLAAFVALGFVCSMFGLAADVDAAWRANLKAAGYAAVTFLVLALADSRRRLTWLAVALFASGVLESIYGAFMVLSGVEYGFLAPKIAGRGWATGTFVNRNHLAGFIEMTAALGIGLLVAQLSAARESGWREHVRSVARILLGPKLWLRTLLVAMVIALVLTQSRMGNVAFFAGLAVAGAAALALIRPLPRMLVVLLVSILVVDLVVIGSWFGVEKVAKRLTETTVAPADVAHQASTDAERVYVARATLAMWRSHPLIGVGPGGFRSTFAQFKPTEVELFYDHAHDDWLELLAERGAVGAALWAYVAGAGFVAAILAMRRRHDPWLRGLGFGAAMGLVALAAHAIADFNLQIPVNAAYFQALIGMGLASLHVAEGRSRRRDIGENH